MPIKMIPIEVPDGVDVDKVTARYDPPWTPTSNGSMYADFCVTVKRAYQPVKVPFIPLSEAPWAFDGGPVLGKWRHGLVLVEWDKEIDGWRIYNGKSIFSRKKDTIKEVARIDVEIEVAE